MNFCKLAARKPRHGQAAVLSSGGAAVISPTKATSHGNYSAGDIYIFIEFRRDPLARP